MSLRALLAVVVVGAAGDSPLVLTLPTETSLRIRLTSSVGSRSSRVDEPVSAVLIAPVELGGARVVPAGWPVHGVVRTVGKASPRDGRSALELAFTRLEDARGNPTPITARVVEVDNARESVDERGRILSLAPRRSHPGTVESLLLLAAHAHPIMLGVVETGHLAERRMSEAPIDYRPGVELTLSLSVPATLAAPAIAQPVLPALEVSGLETLATLPLRAVAAKNRQPADFTNVLVLGTQDELVRVFEEAGWTRALPMGTKADMKALLALANRHGYAPAPVSLLELEGRQPDIVFEKQNNTLAKRHHVRFWARAESLDGRLLFLGAATHDIGIFFATEQKTFTHRIDTRVDRERDKIVTDLEFTGRVASWTLVERPGVPRSDQNAAGDRIETDGRLAVLVLR